MLRYCSVFWSVFVLMRELRIVLDSNFLEGWGTFKDKFFSTCFISAFSRNWWDHVAILSNMHYKTLWCKFPTFLKSLTSNMKLLMFGVFFSLQLACMPFLQVSSLAYFSRYYIHLDLKTHLLALILECSATS